MSNTIYNLIADMPMHCTVCERAKGDPACMCWVTLKCNKCGMSRLTTLDESDPPGTARVECLCPECAGGDFSLINYFDKNGKQILVDQQSGDHSPK